MKIFKTIKELKEAPKEIQEKVISWIDDREDSTAILEGDIDFMWYFGGWIYLIETTEDVEYIPSTVENPDDLDGGKRPDLYGFYNIIEAESDYDIAEWDSEYAILISITSDSGGAAYFVPEEIAKQIANIMKAIKQREDEKCL